MTQVKIRKRTWSVPEVKARMATATTATRWTNTQINALLNRITELESENDTQKQTIKVLTQLVDPSTITPATRTALSALGVHLPTKKRVAKK